MNPDFSKINTIIFDLGNVIVDIDFVRSHDAFSKLSGYESSRVKEIMHTSGIFHRYERGELEKADFMAELAKLSNTEPTDPGLVTSWNALLLDVEEARISRILEVGKNYHTAILSNTNPTHIEEVNNKLEKFSSIDSLNQLVHDVFLSYELGMMKPEPEIYTTVLEKLKKEPAEVLFFDDKEENIVAAKEVGIQAVMVEPPQTILDYLSNA